MPKFIMIVVHWFMLISHFFKVKKKGTRFQDGSYALIYLAT